MSASPLMVRKAAVLGAGVMGAQIAAHFVNARVPVMLFELAARSGDANGNVLKAVAGLKTLEPSPLATPGVADRIEPANYDQHLERLLECDLIIEAISERMDWKADLYRKVAPYIAGHAIFASNTSGLSINTLAGAMPAAQRPRFCGVHFFNPPRYMHLVELVACDATDAGILDELERFLTTTLGKGVVRARDTPNFIANRVGVFSMLATLHHAARCGLGFDTVDALTGTLIGRPKSATFRTADVVGLDTFAHVVHTMHETLPQDPWHGYYGIPAWMQKLIDAGALGQKTRKGVYRKPGRDIEVLDPNTGDYRRADGRADEAVVEILNNRNLAERFARLHASGHAQAQFLWSVFRDTFHYCAVHLESIAHNARDLDLALRWGFGWSSGPFEIWQSAGWQSVAGWIADDIAAGNTLVSAPLPAWAADPARSGVHSAEGSWSPAGRTYAPRSSLPVYGRQPFPDRLAGEERRYGSTVFETGGVRCWHLGDDIAVVSFKSRMHTIDEEVLEGVQRAIDEAERHFAGLVIWQTGAPFCAGANLKMTPAGGVQPASAPAPGGIIGSVRLGAESVALGAARQLGLGDPLLAGRLAGVAHLVGQFQATTQQLKYAMVPTVAAVDGLALGGGCELIMHCDRTVATLESYIGLVEVGVGLLPAGGGCKELAMRAAAEAAGGDPAPLLLKYFKAVAMAEVGRSAEHARELGYLRCADRVVMNRFELLEVARSEARALAAAGYRPPPRATAIPVAGRAGIATIQAFVENMHAGGHISAHDRLIALNLATVMCGGEVEAGSLVDEQWLLDLELQHFMALMATAKTQARIEFMLKNGKPLRN